MERTGDDALQPPPRPRTSSPVRLGAIVAIGLGVAFIAWLLVARGDDDETAAPPTTVANAAPQPPAEVSPTIVSLGQLSAAAAESATPLYWAGPRPGTRYELTRTANGAVYVRYLPKGAAAGDVEPALTVVTYPMPDGLARIRTATRSAGATRIVLPGGGLAVVDAGRPTNIHFAYPGQSAQVEVYAPQSGVARRLVRSGAVRPLG